MRKLLPKAELLKKLTRCKVFVHNWEEKYSNDIEKSYTTIKAPSWLKQRK